jgi:outer membrane lipoprotein carrier protein
LLAGEALFSGRALPSGDTLSGDLAKFEARYQSARTASATFLELYSENGQLTRTEAGTAYFRRPSRMRWEYAAPEKNLFIVDGKSAWFYVPADRTVTRVPAKRSADWRTPLALLAGDVKVSRVCSHVNFAVTEKPRNAGDVMLLCRLRGDDHEAPGLAGDFAGNKQAGTQDAAVFLELAPTTGELVRVLIADKGGVSIEFRFENWNFAAVLPDSEFRFHPPAGVVILNGELPLQNGTMK